MSTSVESTDPLRKLLVDCEGLAFRRWRDRTPSPTERGAVVRTLRHLELQLRDDPGLRAHARELADLLDIDDATPTDRVPPASFKSPALMLGLARHARSRQPLSAAWAANWAMAATAASSHEARRHAPHELRELMELRLKSSSSVVVVQSTAKPLVLKYRALSPDLNGLIRVERPELHEPQTALPHALVTILQDALLDLGEYGHALASGRTRRQSLRGLALLPPELAPPHEPELEAMAEHLDRLIGNADEVVLPALEVFPEALPTRASSLNKRDSELLLELVGRLGFKIEPDVRMFGPPLEGGRPVVVFRGRPLASPPSAGYVAATALIHLSVMVAKADGTVDAREEALLRQRVESRRELSEPEHRRLSAHLTWLLSSDPRILETLQRLKSLEHAQRDQIGRFLVEVAAADGRIDRTEIELLERAFDRLGVSRRRLEQLLGDPHAQVSDLLRPAARSSAPAPRGNRRQAPADPAADDQYDTLMSALFGDEDGTSNAFGASEARA